MSQNPIAVTRAVAGLLLAGALVAAHAGSPRQPAPVSAKLSEWTIQLSKTTVPGRAGHLHRHEWRQHPARLRGRRAGDREGDRR